MPISKNQVERLQFIHQLLQNKGFYTAEILLKKIETDFKQKISRRTLIEDINYLREKGAPIPLRAKQYHYTKPFSLFNILESNDSTLLQELQGVVNQLSKLNKIDKVFGINLNLKLADEESKLVFFDWHQDLLDNIDLLPECLEYIQSKKVVQIRFQDFNKPVIEGNLHPYLLKEYNGRWYICGLWEKDYQETGQKKIHLFALDRIRIKPAIKPSLGFIKNDWFDPDSFFDKMIGVTNLYGTQKPQKIVVRVYGLSVQYLEAKRLHHSQELIFETQTEDFADFKFYLIDNYEFRSKILALGSNAEVLEPSELRKSFAEIAEKMRKRYLE